MSRAGIYNESKVATDEHTIRAFECRVEIEAFWDDLEGEKVKCER